MIINELVEFLKFLHKYNRAKNNYERILMKSVMYESKNRFFLRWDNPGVIRK